MLDPDVLSQAVYWWLAATDDETFTAQLVPTPHAVRTVPFSFTISTYQMVGPTLTFVVAVTVTDEPAFGVVLPAERPVRQVPSAAQLVPVTGVVVATGLLAVQLTVTVLECGPPPAIEPAEVLSQAV